MAKQTTKKKTIGELLNELPEGVRELALANTSESRGNEFPEEQTVKDALLEAFTWSDSREGMNYWNHIISTL